MLRVEIADVEHCKVLPQQERFLEKADLHGQGVTTYAICTGDTRVGCAAVHKSQLLYFAVDQAYQGNGFGRNAMLLLLALYPDMTLRVHPDNAPAIALYSSLGFIFIDSPDVNGEILGTRVVKTADPPLN